MTTLLSEIGRHPGSPRVRVATRAIGHTWKELWSRLRKLEERKDVGRALSAEEQARLLDAVGALRLKKSEEHGTRYALFLEGSRSNLSCQPLRMNPAFAHFEKLLKG